MKAKTSNAAKGMSGETFRMWEDSFRNGLKLQDEALRSWQGTLNSMDCDAAMQKQYNKMRAMTAGIRPSIQKRMEEVLELIDQNARLEIDMHQLMREMVKSADMADCQSKLVDCWKLAMKGARHNAEAVVQMQAHAMDSWIEMTRKSCEFKA